jgi:hypothetical protein
MVHRSFGSLKLSAFLLTTVLIIPTSPAFARETSTTQHQNKNLPFTLEWPVDCTLGKTCWIARYMDRKAGPEKADYLCKAQTEDKHKGTDIVIPDLGSMQTGVNVRAAANGRVLALRNGMADKAVTKESRAAIMKQGWQTHYCHLKNNSLLVKKGDTVKAGQIIGQVGLSGLTEYPHLHFMVQHTQAGQPARSIDPFDGGEFEKGCNASPDHPALSLWRNKIAYSGPAVMPPLITSAPVTRQQLWQAQTPKLPATAPMLRIQARGFHTLPGDIWRFALHGPDGKLQFTYDVKQRKQRQLVGANAYKNRPKSGFMAGKWTATVTLLRDSTVTGSAQSHVKVTQN